MRGGWGEEEREEGEEQEEKKEGKTKKNKMEKGGNVNDQSNSRERISLHKYRNILNRPTIENSLIRLFLHKIAAKGAFFKSTPTYLCHSTCSNVKKEGL